VADGRCVWRAQTCHERGAACPAFRRQSMRYSSLAAPRQMPPNRTVGRRRPARQDRIPARFRGTRGRAKRGYNRRMPATIRDKKGLLVAPQRAKLDLGCGSRKHRSDYIGVDLLDHPEVDVVGDAVAVLASLPAGCLERVYSSHFLEHLGDLDGLLRELERTMATGAELEIIVPHFSNPYFYSDPTHTRTFGLYSFGYYVKDTFLRRQVPRYGNDTAFRMTSISLNFKSSPPFYVRYGIKRLIGLLVNMSRWCKEFYEENLCFLLPCYEVRFLMVRT
jgi:hypothetical protein